MEIKPSFSEFKRLSEQGDLIPVYEEFLADVDTPVSAYLKIQDKSYSYLLESAESGERWGRYSFIGYKPYVIVLSKGSEVEIHRGSQKEIIEDVENPLDVLREISRKFTPVTSDDLAPFQGGLVGYFNFDLIRKWEDLPGLAPDDKDIPECLFAAARRIIIFDHLKHRMTVVAFAHLKNGKDPKESYSLACREIEEMKEELKGPLPAYSENNAFSLSELLTKKPATLSGGERQIVAIARCLVYRPKLLLMDEPLSALDIKRRAAILNYIETIPAKYNIPILYVTHSIDEVARLADNIILMEKGHIIAHGPVDETLARLDLPPLTGRFEAGTILAGTVGTTDPTFALTTIHVGSQSLTIPRLDLPLGHKIRLRVRARDVALATKELVGISIRNSLFATITEIAPEPDTAFAEIRLSVESQNLRARITRASLHDLALEEGKPVLALIKSIAMDRRLLVAPGAPDTRTR